MKTLCDSCRREENDCPMNPPGKTTSCSMFERDEKKIKEAEKC